MRISSLIRKIEDFFLIKTFSWKRRKETTEFEEFLLLIKDFFDLKKRKRNKDFQAKLAVYTSNLNAFCKRTSKDREDPTIDTYIQQHGGIKSHVDRKVYTTKSAYLDSIKRADKHIHE